MKKAIATLLLLLVCQISQAELVRYEKANFSIDVPATWKEAEAPPETLAVFRSPDNAKGLALITVKFSKEDSPTALERMVSGAKGAAQKSNVPISGEHDKVIDGVPFRVYSTTLPGNVSVNSAMAVVGEKGYSVQAFSRVSDAATDPAIIAMLESFRLLAKPSTPAAVIESSKSEAYEFGQVLGRWGVIAFIAGAIILTVLKAFKGKKKPD